MIRKLIAAVSLSLALAGCATNPVTGKQNVVLGTMKGEQESARRAYEEIIRVYGIYEDQSIQDYVNSIGQRLVRNSHLPDLPFKFTVLDDGSINAFTTGGGYVYLNRGLLTYLNSEAELASVIGHEIGHVTARHPARRQTRGVLASVLATGAAIATGSRAVGELANLGAVAWIQGYGRDNEMEADRLGLEYAAKTHYRPEAMGDVFHVFKSQERFEVDRARQEGRDPNVYHGVFSSHPAPDARAVQAAKGAAQIESVPSGGWVENRELYLNKLDGMPYGSSRAQGIVRDNRFYHADMNITLAFPKGWTIDNLRDRLLAHTTNKDTIMQVLVEKRPATQPPREFLLQKLKGQPVSGGEALSANGLEGYALIVRQGSPLDGGVGPVRWVVIYKDTSAYIFAGASRSVRTGVPEADGLFLSVAQTLRSLKPSEFPLAEPFRINVIKASATTKLDDYAKSMPVEKFQKEELLLLNGLYPDKKPASGQLIKVVE